MALMAMLKGGENRYIHLLMVLAVFFLCTPLVNDIQSQFAFLAVLFFLAIILTLRAIELTGRDLALTVGVGVAAVIVGFGSFVTLWAPWRHSMIAASLALYAVFMTASIVFMVKKMFSASKVTGDVIRGGIGVYILLGFLWTLFYVLVYHFDRGAFTTALAWHDSYLFYFSFTTLTTLGYGDICPANRIAMLLSNAEVIIGQLYLAIFVARLVGLHIVDRSSRHSS